MSKKLSKKNYQKKIFKKLSKKNYQKKIIKKKFLKNDKKTNQKNLTNHFYASYFS